MQTYDKTKFCWLYKQNKGKKKKLNKKYCYGLFIKVGKSWEDYYY